MELNKIYNMDCEKGLKLLKDNFCDVGFTSPPYNRIRNDVYEHYNDTLEDYYGTIVRVTSEMLRVCKNQVIVNIQANHFNKTDVFRYIGQFAEYLKGIVVWEKLNPQPATNFREQDETYSITNAYEFFFVLACEKQKSEDFRANNKIKNIIQTGVNTLSFEGHSAVMKYEVAEWFINNFTKEGDIILDSFMGLGTTALACENLKRKWIGFEISEEYVKMANERIEKQTRQFKLDI
ncbi:MAG: site-specific DNA-methyltransferase [Acutalibacteraceae bacterium]|nr:site-specific DNA-methyltransferase [Acutalibacteraceae bacterium]